MSTQILPLRVAAQAGEDVQVELRGAADEGMLLVRHLGDVVREVRTKDDGVYSLGRLRPGGYGVELLSPTAVARTAIDVHEPEDLRMRYGFTASYRPGRSADAFAERLRALHVTHVQFYDWAYRHADLLGGGPEYLDALEQPISLDTVARLVGAVQGIGAAALGYVAVYGVGDAEWPRWEAGALLDGEGVPYGLGTFLRLVDPAWQPWLQHLSAEVKDAADRLGFDGFHLDQYGYPKFAQRADGTLVDLAESFVSAVSAVRDALPGSTLVFNNVNDFPTARVATAPQDAIYIEPWAPTITLGDLADVAARARSVAAGKPVVLAAYQSVYNESTTAEADQATALTMAALFSHGATQLLVGEEDRILVDPYYVRNRRAGPSTETMLRHYSDFLVEHDEVLMHPGLVDVTASMAGEYNDDCDVTYAEVDVTGVPTAGSVWRRITRLGPRLIVHLINLRGQTETGWDTPKRQPHEVLGGQLRFRAVHGVQARIRVSEPQWIPSPEDLDARAVGAHQVVELPPLRTWQVVIVDLLGAPGPDSEKERA